MLAVFSLLSATADGTNVIRRAEELAKAVAAGEGGRRFTLQATTSFSLRANSRVLFVEDASGGIAICDWLHTSSSMPEAGDRLLITGITDCDGSAQATAKCRTCQVLSKGSPPAPLPADAARLLDGAYDYRLVRICGTVRDVFHDEIDPDWDYLVLSSDGNVVYVTFPKSETGSSLIGADVAIVGVCNPFMSGRRRKAERFVTTDFATGITVLKAAYSDPFGVPNISDLQHLRAAKIATVGRRRAIGKVLAVWHGNRMMIRTARGQTIAIELAEGELPRCGETVEVVGLPETDFYKINLTRSRWRKSTRPVDFDDAVTNVSAKAVLTDPDGRMCIEPRFDGRLICLSGLVRSLPAVGGDSDRLYLESDGFLVPVDVSGCPSAAEGVSVGCEIAATGVCAMEAENWRPNSVFPKIRGFSVILRKPNDLLVLSRPPWWTPARLLAVIGTLLLVILAVVIWNGSLRKIVERRSRELKKEILARVSADLKVEERTRLAVELHDSVAQNLTGVALEIDAASDFAETDRARMTNHLNIAAKTLKSCRDELRNCLWDLRNQALEDDDMNDAIRRTLAPHASDVELSVRFNVPRSRFSDNTTHAILRIVRELTVNAIRHGRATSVKIAGSIEKELLMFSVRDNGCGFNPNACPGMREGHFGLQGIRERVARLEGTVTIDSGPDENGTKVTIALHAPRIDIEETT